MSLWDMIGLCLVGGLVVPIIIVAIFIVVAVIYAVIDCLVNRGRSGEDK